jgi:hypothetical protein
MSASSSPGRRDRSTQQIDRWLAGARETWQAAARRDDMTHRAPSERRLAGATKPTRRPNALLVGLAFAVAMLVTAIARRSGHAAAPEIHAEPVVAPVVAPVLETAEPAASLEAPAVESPPLKSAAPAPSASALPPLPHVWSPSERREMTAKDRAELRAAVRDIARGDAVHGRQRLRALQRHAEPPIVYEAAKALARSYDEPTEEVAAWDASLPLIDPDTYRALAMRERDRALREIGKKKEEKERRKEREERERD